MMRTRVGRSAAAAAATTGDLNKCMFDYTTRIFNEHGIQVSHSKVYQIQVQRDDLEAGRPNTRVIRPLPKQAQFHAVGKRGERYL